MSTSGISNVSHSYLQQALASAFQSAETSTNASANGVSAPASLPQADSTQLSPFAQLASVLQQLQQSDPTKYKQVTEQIATTCKARRKRLNRREIPARRTSSTNWRPISPMLPNPVSFRTCRILPRRSAPVAAAITITTLNRPRPALPVPAVKARRVHRPIRERLFSRRWPTAEAGRRPADQIPDRSISIFRTAASIRSTAGRRYAHFSSGSGGGTTIVAFASKSRISPLALNPKSMPA
jgi:hypothetical protein